MAAAAGAFEQADYRDLGIDTAYEPVPGSLRVSDDGDRIVVRYLAFDPWPPMHFFSPTSRRGHISDVADAFSVALVRSQGRYAIAAPGEAAQAWWRAPAGADAGNLVEEARKALESYDAWLEGELCGIVTETFAGESGRLKTVDLTVEWPHVSLTIAEGMIQERDDICPAPVPGF